MKNRTLPRAAAALAVLAALLGAGGARADSYLDDWHPYQTYWAVSYEMAFPVGSIPQNWINTPSWLGVAVDIRVGVWNRLSVGVSATWNSMDQTFSSLLLERPGLTFTGPVNRRLAIFSARATTHYYFTNGTLQPFAGIGLGWAWGTAPQQTVNREETFYPDGFLVAPEVGLLVNVVPRLAVTAVARYQYTLMSWAGVKNAQWPSVQAGVAYFW